MSSAPASSSSSSKKAGRGGGGRGKGRGGGGRRSGRGKGNKRSNNNNGNNNNNNNNNNANTNTSNNNGNNATARAAANDNSSHPIGMPSMRDEEVLIKFMPYLKGDNYEAMSLYEQYQSNNDQPAFLRAARHFLSREQQKPTRGEKESKPPPTPAAPAPSPAPVLPHAGSIPQTANASSAANAANTVNAQPQPTTVSRSPLSTSMPQTTPTMAPPPSTTDPFANPSTSHNINPSHNINSSHNINNNPAPYGQLPPMLRLNPQPDNAFDAQSSPDMESLERKMISSILSDDNDPVISMPLPFQNNPVSAIGPGFVGSSPARPPMGGVGGGGIFHNPMSAPTPLGARGLPMHGRGHGHGHGQNQQQSLPFQFQQPPQNSKLFPITPPRNIGGRHPGMPIQHQPLDAASPFGSLFPSNGTADNGKNNTQPPFLQQQQLEQQQLQQQQQAPVQAHHQIPIAPAIPATTATTTTATTPTVSASWPSNPAPNLPNHSSATPPPANASRSRSRSASHSPAHTPPPPQTPQPSETPATNDAAPSGADGAKQLPPPPPTTTKKEYQPKRLWTRLEDQPGKLMANNVAASLGTVLNLRPRQELTAQWMVPLSYLREHASGKDNVRSLRDHLANLAVGLFRRGCTENGAQASIVSKEILSPAGETRPDYPFQVINDAVIGTVPFYSPRTPGHVVFRLYWQDEPLHTLATGPTLNVRVTEDDFESSIRFILSNFKAKKVNPTSLSSLNSFALVLEQFHVPPEAQQGAQHRLDGAGRAIWGCICEARKVLDACASEYTKTTAKLEKLEESVEELKIKVEEEEEEAEKEEAEEADLTSNDDTELVEPSETVLQLREKQKALMSGRASCERKWRDSQLAFSSILRAVVTNPSVSLLLHKNLITKMRLEYELWCPLCEEFAVPGDSEAKMWHEPLANLPHQITADHFRICSEARSKMQVRILGFDPNINKLENILYPNRRTNQMNPSAVNVFNQLSTATGQLYQDVNTSADLILRQREAIRAQTEKFVNLCDCFPPATKVAVFGSSANGFGSPKSDLDMCLQIPHGYPVTAADDPTGSQAMAKLAEVLEQNGMKDVDISRLTARIPVIKFNCPKPLENGEETSMECDLSMHNPLAVLNTSLLRTYAEINPVAKVLSAVIKRWAKARDINNPARHTLSSYGYIIMLLHFLTFHKRAVTGLVIPVPRKDEKDPHARPIPLLPNLQWMDPKWPDATPGTPYMEQASMPLEFMQHPLEEKAKVNRYFYRPNANQLENLRRMFPGQDLSLGILLASFFRYYAYEFDYKRHVVSLQSTISHGLIEREVKAELDGWRNYSAALTIEDPFETFYDVAHVLRGGYYHRIRREFAVAYSKIADLASGKTSSTWSNKTVDLSTMTGSQLIDWICEPVANEREEGTTS